MRWGIVDAILLGILLGIGGCQPSVEVSSPPPPVVLVVKPTPESAARTQTYTGMVRPRYETDQAFRIGGKIVSRKVDVGDRVEAGQVLLTLDNRDQTLALQAATNDVQAAAARARSAIRDEERLRQLRELSSVSASEYDQSKASRDTAEEQLQKAERMVELATNKVSYCTLRAETDGVITAILAEVGQVIAEGQPVLKLARSGHREAVVSIPEHKLSEAKTLSAQLTFWANPQAPIPTTLRELTPAADPTTRTYLAKYPIPDGSPAELGMTVSVQLQPVTTNTILAVPPTAVARRGDQSGVWVAEASLGRLKFTPVTIHEFRQDRVLVAGGLKGSEWIVKSGVQKLDEGLTVRVREVSP